MNGHTEMFYPAEFTAGEKNHVVSENSYYFFAVKFEDVCVCVCVCVCLCVFVCVCVFCFRK